MKKYNMLTISIQEIKFIQKIKGKYPLISLREIGRQCKAKFGVTRHMNTIKNPEDYADFDLKDLESSQ